MSSSPTEFDSVCLAGAIRLTLKALSPEPQKGWLRRMLSWLNPLTLFRPRGYHHVLTKAQDELSDPDFDALALLKALLNALSSPIRDILLGDLASCLLAIKDENEIPKPLPDEAKQAFTNTVYRLHHLDALSLQHMDDLQKALNQACETGQVDKIKKDCATWVQHAENMAQLKAEAHQCLHPSLGAKLYRLLFRVPLNVGLQSRALLTMHQHGLLSLENLRAMLQAPHAIEMFAKEPEHAALQSQATFNQALQPHSPSQTSNPKAVRFSSVGGAPGTVKGKPACGKEPQTPSSGPNTTQRL